jgi:prepilin-type N-terminal cleavage/methylation domain-containing protein
MKTANALNSNGFTLVELMVAAAASVIVIGVTMSSVISFQQMSQNLDDKLKQEAELQRALHFIATDIQEGKLIRANPPTISGYRRLFEIERPDGSTIGYYLASPVDRPWSGPKIIYRRDTQGRREDATDAGEDAEISGTARSYALIDQISDKSPQNCSGTGTPIVRPGLSIFIDNQRKATICIRGDLSASPEGLEQSIQATTRVGP